jgi:hypothetical protein
MNAGPRIPGDGSAARSVGIAEHAPGISGSTPPESGVVTTRHTMLRPPGTSREGDSGRWVQSEGIERTHPRASASAGNPDPRPTLTPPVRQWRVKRQFAVPETDFR